MVEESLGRLLNNPASMADAKTPTVNTIPVRMLPDGCAVMVGAGKATGSMMAPGCTLGGPSTVGAGVLGDVGTAAEPCREPCRRA